MDHTIFEPFGETMPVATSRTTDLASDAAGRSSTGLYKAAVISFWLIVAVILVARITFHGNIFAFGG